MNEGLTHHLPRRLLNSICSTNILSYNSKLSHQSEQESQHEAPPTKKFKKKKKIIRRWKKNFPLNNPNFVLSNSVPAISEQTKENLKNPLDTFNAMISCDIITHITHQTNLYASQKGKNLNCDESEVITVIAIILLSGYCKVPCRDLYWSGSPDTHNEAVSNEMSRNRFREIFSCLHLANNAEINEDRYYKVRPIFDMLNNNLKKYLSANDHSVDESMIPYYGKHRTKQFIRGKPIRFGFKLWCFTSTEGYLFPAEPYCGSDTKLKDTGLGQGADVVLGLIEKCNLSSGCTLTFDNLFTSLPLLDELSKRGIGGLGTLRQNRLENTPVPKKQLMKKTIRGSYQGATDNHGNTVVVWHDTAVVTCASNYAEALPESFVTRWSKTKKRKLILQFQTLIYCTISKWEE